MFSKIHSLAFYKYCSFYNYRTTIATDFIENFYEKTHRRLSRVPRLALVTVDLRLSRNVHLDLNLTRGGFRRSSSLHSRRSQPALATSSLCRWLPYLLHVGPGWFFLGFTSPFPFCVAEELQLPRRSESRLEAAEAADIRLIAPRVFFEPVRIPEWDPKRPRAVSKIIGTPLQSFCKCYFYVILLSVSEIRIFKETRSK